MEVRNIFEGLDLIYRVPDELWMEVCDTVQKIEIKTSPKKKKCKKQNGCLRRPYKEEKKRSKKQRRKGKLFLFESRVPKINKER